MPAPAAGALHLSEPPRSLHAIRPHAALWTVQPRGFARNDGNGSSRLDGCSRDTAEVFLSTSVQAAGDLLTHHFGHIGPP